jgi:hypothetical protein
LAGLVTTPLQPFNLNATPTTGQFFASTPAAFGYDPGTGTPTAWGSNNVVLVPNNSGNVILWYYAGTGGAGIAQVLVGQVLAGQALPASTAITVPANSCGWFGPFSPATYNVNNVNVVPLNSTIAGAPTIATWPNAAVGCYAVAFTTTTNLLVRAYTFSNVQP